MLADHEASRTHVRIRRPRASTVWLALLAVAAATSMGYPASGDEPTDESAAKAAEAGRPAEESSRREERRRRKAAEEPLAATDPAPAIHLPADPDTQMVCRTYRQLGSRIPKRVCSTAAEWAAREASDLREADRFSREMRERSSMPPPADVTPGRTPL